jgi:hypothetical protein
MSADQITAEGGGLDIMEDRVRSAGREAHRAPPPLSQRHSFAHGAGMFAVETTPAGIRVIIPTGELEPSQLDEVLSWLRLESVTRRSAMAESGKAQWWAANKSRFIQTGP